MVARQLLCHQAVEKGRADHEADQEAGALDGDGREGHRDGVDGGCTARVGGGGDKVAAEGGGEEQRVGGEDPDRGHCVDGEDSGVFNRGCWVRGKGGKGLTGWTRE